MVIEWECTALPVLNAIAVTEDRNLRNGILHVGRGERGAATLGLEISDGEVHDSLLALADVGYVSINDIQYASGGNASFLGIRVTGRGMQALGQWPSLRAAMTPMTLSAVLDRLQDYAPDQKTREELVTASDTVKSAGSTAVREAVTAFAAEAVKAKLGLR
jgi:hypothetical protein